MAPAAHVRVEVHHLAGTDRSLTTQGSAMRRRGRRLAIALLPVLALTLAATIGGLIRDAEGEGVETILIVIGTLVFIALITVWLMRRQKRRALSVPGRVWVSRHAFYPGPYDADGDPGLPGSARFARKHTGQGVVPIVRLVLTPAALVIVPTQGRRDQLSCPLSEISTIIVTQAGRKDSGLTITSREGRTASFMVETDNQFILELQTLGATVRPSP
jgi:hypothetical protein